MTQHIPIDLFGSETATQFKLLSCSKASKFKFLNENKKKHCLSYGFDSSKFFIHFFSFQNFLLLLFLFNIHWFDGVNWFSNENCKFVGWIWSIKWWNEFPNNLKKKNTSLLINSEVFVCLHKSIRHVNHNGNPSTNEGVDKKRIKINQYEDKSTCD